MQEHDDGSRDVIAGNDVFESAVEKGLTACIAESRISEETFFDGATNPGPTFGNDYCVSMVLALKPETTKQKLIIYCEGEKNLEEVDRDLLAIFCENVSVAWQNQLNAY